MLDQFFDYQTRETALRMLIALGLCGLLGLEREIRRSPAGLRTHMSVGAGACLFMLLTDLLIQRYSVSGEAIRADPVRIISAVTSGVAFLAAGAIIQLRGHVVGLTTGGSLWIAGAIGVGCGMGEYRVSTVAVLVILPILALVRVVEHRLFDKHRTDQPTPGAEDVSLDPVKRNSDSSSGVRT